MARRILLVDDDTRLTEMLSEYLSQRGFDTDQRADGENALNAIEDGDFDAVILDVMLPDLDGFEICRRVRAKSEIPVIMLTARGEEADRIVGLEIGADDYLPKPFNPRELLARINAVLRRRTPPPSKSSVLKFDGLEIDLGARAIRVRGEECDLTGHQFDILRVLAERHGRVQSRDQLMQALKNQDHDVFDRSIDVHISRIRAAIEEDPKHPKRIKTVRGVGYVFADFASDP